MQLEDVIQKIGNEGCLNAEENRYLFELREKADTEEQQLIYKQLLALGNIGLVKYESYKYHFFWKYYDDILQEAHLALLQAIDAFDVKKGIAFSSFACSVISKKLSDYFINMDRLIRIPRKVYDKNRKEHIEKYQLLVKNTTPLSMQELDDECYFSDKMNLDDVMIQQEYIKELWSKLNDLPEQEREMICDRYGIYNDGQMMSFKDLGKKYGMETSVMFRRINKILKKLRANFTESESEK